MPGRTGIEGQAGPIVSRISILFKEGLELTDKHLGQKLGRITFLLLNCIPLYVFITVYTI